MKELQSSHPSLYYFLMIFFVAFIVIQIISGVFLFIEKIGLQPHQWYEYYYGSENMLRYFPHALDRFKEPLTFRGRLKVIYIHILAYSILIFTISHLLRSLNKKENRKQWLEKLIFSYFCIGGGEIALDIVLVFLKDKNFYVQMGMLSLRVIFFILFVLFTLSMSALLVQIIREEKNCHTPEKNNV